MNRHSGAKMSYFAQTTIVVLSLMILLNKILYVMHVQTTIATMIVNCMMMWTKLYFFAWWLVCLPVTWLPESLRNTLTWTTPPCIRMVSETVLWCSQSLLLWNMVRVSFGCWEKRTVNSQYHMMVPHIMLNVITSITDGTDCETLIYREFHVSFIGSALRCASWVWLWNTAPRINKPCLPTSLVPGAHPRGPIPQSIIMTS